MNKVGSYPKNRIKENFSVKGLSSQRFYATKVAFRFAFPVYKIIDLFRLVASKKKNTTNGEIIFHNLFDFAPSISVTCFGFK